MPSRLDCVAERSVKAVRVAASWLSSKVLRTFEQPFASRRRSRRAGEQHMESLKSRAMLAGNVAVQISGIDAILSGDAADNSVEIVASGNSIVVRGINNTTINGGTSPFTLSAASSSFAGSVRATLGGGNDALGISGITISGSLSVDGGAGRNSFNLQNAAVSGNVSVNSTGVALVDLSSSSVGGELRIVTGSGDDDIVLRSLNVSGPVRMETNQGSDDMVLQQSTLDRGLHVTAGRGNDIVFIDNSTIQERAVLWMLQGNDSVQIQGNSSLPQGAFVGALLGRDSVEIIAPASVTPLRRLGRPSRNVSDALIESRITGSAGAIAAAGALSSQFSSLLTVQVAADSIAETAGVTATELTVTRSGSTAAALTVNLTSSDPGRAKTAASVTIPVGQSSVTVPIEAVDNTTTDPDTVVSFTASATGFRSGTDTVTGTGQETAALTLSIPATTLTEDAAEAARTLTVTRSNTDLTQPLTVSLTSGSSRLTIPATITIPANAASTTFVAVAENSVVDGNAQVLIAAVSTGFTGSQLSVTVNDNDSPTLTVTPATSNVGESNSGGVQLQIARNTADTSQPLTVNLSSGSSRLALDATSATIPAGQSSTTIVVRPTANTVIDGNVAVTVTASASGFANGTSTVTVNDDEGPTLTISPALPSFAENADTAARTLTITRSNTDLTQPLNVALSLGSTARMNLSGSASTTVVIPANSASATFVITAIDNTTADGTGTAQLTASANGFTETQVPVAVTDNDTAALSLSLLSSSVVESSTTGVQVTVSRNTSDLSQAVSVSLASGSSRLTVPESVTIPVNTSSVTFAAIPVNNSTAESNLSVQITATATGFAAGTTTLTITDDDSPALTITPASPSFAEDADSAARTVTVTRSQTDLTQSLSVTLSLASTVRMNLAGGASTTVVIPANAPSATFVITALDNSIVDGTGTTQLTASATGFTSTEVPVAVTDNDTAVLSVSPLTNTVSESNSAGVQITVLRNTADTSQAVSVTLNSGSSRLTIPANVTIPANSASVSFIAIPVDNDIDEDDLSVQISVSASGFATGTTTLTITDDDVNPPSLTISPASPSFAEDAEEASRRLTITRSRVSLAQPLTVSLNLSATNRMSLPGNGVTTTVEIPANSASVTFVMNAVNNTVADGTGTALLTASAAGFGNVQTQVSVTDNETPTLTVSLASASTGESNSAGVIVTVERNTTDVSQPLTVSLTPGTAGSTRLTTPGSVSIPAGQQSVTFAATPTDNDIDEADAAVQISASANGFTSGSATVTVTDDDVNPPTLTITPASPSFAENSDDAARTLTLTRSHVSLTEALTVSLALAPTSRATLPGNGSSGTVEIPANQASVTFVINTVNNSVFDGTGTASLSVSAGGFTGAQAQMSVTDDEVATLTLSPTSAAVAENSSAGVQLTLTRNTVDVTQALSVTLSPGSGGSSRLTTPATVAIPAGQSSVTFTADPTDNALDDGNQDVSISAAASGFVTGSATVTVQDDDNLTTALTLTSSSAQVNEANTAGLELTVRRSAADLSQPLQITISAGTGSDRLSFPQTVTIPANTETTTFSVTPQNNELLDGSQTVTFTVSASGFSDTTAQVTVTEDDAANLTIVPVSASVDENAGLTEMTVSLGRVTTIDRIVQLAYQFPDVLTGPATATIPAGQSGTTVTLIVAENSVTDGSIVTGILGQVVNLTSVSSATITVNDVDSIPLTASTAGIPGEASNGTRITRESTVTITGTTSPGVDILVDSDGDGIFDDATEIADPDGNYSVTVTLTHTTENNGANRIVIRAENGPEQADTAVNLHLAVGSVMRLESNAGTFDVELLDTAAPLTVANFKSYEASSAWNNLIVHRSVTDFVIQSGGFTVSGGRISGVTELASVTNEFATANSNLRGTLSMALVPNDPASGTSQWFINVVDNSALDANLHTVFGRVIGTGMSVVDSINSIVIRNVASLYGNPVLDEVPLRNPAPPGALITGTVAQTAGSPVFVGTGTVFTTDLQTGSSVIIGGKLYFVLSIESDTQITLDSNAPATAADLTVRKNVVPADADFVVFSNIHEILAVI